MTRTFKAALLGCVLASPASAQSVITSPKLPQRQGAGDVAAMLLQNTTKADIGAHYLTVGMVFPKGQVASGQALHADIGRLDVTPVQMDERTHWPDGSVRIAALSFLQPAYRAGASAGVVIQRASAQPGAPLSLAAFTPGVATVDLNLGGHGYHLDVANLLGSGTPAYWLRGRQAVEARVDAPITGAMHVTIDARAYADGSSMLDVTFANDLALNKGGPESYAATIKLGKQTVTQQINGQQPFTDWHRQIWSNGAPVVNVVHDIASLEAMGMVPRYPLAAGVQASELQGEKAPNPCTALAPCGITPYMPMTGGRADIGLVPRWDGIWLVTQNPAAAAYALAQADAAGSVPWHVEQAPNVPLLVTSYPQFWADDRCAGNGYKPCSPMSLQSASNGSGAGHPITPDTAHQPGLGYVAYLLTGQHHYLDELAAQAGYSETSAWDAIRNYAAGTGDLVIGPWAQLRGGAWSIREFWQAALAEPDGSSLKTYFAKLSSDNLAYTARLAGNPSKGQLAGWIECTYGSNPAGFPPWQEDYFALSLEWAIHAGVTGAQGAIAAMAPFLVNRFTQPAGTFSPFNGTAYDLVVGNGHNQSLTTWGQSQQATVAYGTSNTQAPIGPPPGSWEFDYGVAATSVVRGLASSPAQQQAISWINANPAAQPGQANPAWLVNP